MNPERRKSLAVLLDNEVLKIISPTGEVGQCRQFIKMLCKYFGESDGLLYTLELPDPENKRNIVITDMSDDEITRKHVGAYSKVEISKSGEKTAFFFTDEKAWVSGPQGQQYDLDRYSIPQIAFPMLQDVWKLVKS